MTMSGIAWGIYTLKGRVSKGRVSDTAYNFIRILPFVAVLSGAIASGIGYAVWYIALSRLSVTQAAVVQLFVPVIAALGGIIFANELISPRLVLASIMILGGILTVVLGKHYFVQWAVEKTEQGN